MEQIIKIGLAVFWFLVFTKLFLFWLWLWQLKNYHLGRFKAHFERQKIKKVFASFYRIKLPVFTKKALAVTTAWFLGVGAFFIFAVGQTDDNFRLLVLLFLFLLPLIASVFILLFQIPVWFWQIYIMRKARKKREQFKNLIVIGITGSFGKTSTKEFLASILKEKYNVLKTSEHINAEVGIAQTILRELKPEHQVFVVEIGAYEKGKIKQVCKMIKPEIGILTGINEQHLATFGSQKNIIKAKFELIEALGEQGIAILNGDNENIKNQISNIKNNNSRLKNIKFVSLEEKTDVWAENILVEKEKISFIAYSQDGDEALFETNLIGRQNIINILMAAACSKELGMRLPKIAQVCRAFKQNNLKKTVSGLNVLDYSYSANPASVMAHLRYLKTTWQGKAPSQKIIIVMPCLIELGSASKKTHYNIGKEIAQVGDLAIITTKDRFKELSRGAKEAGFDNGKMILLESVQGIFEKISSFSQEGDILLLESRAPKALMELLNIG